MESTGFDRIIGYDRILVVRLLLGKLSKTNRFNENTISGIAYYIRIAAPCDTTTKSSVRLSAQIAENYLIEVPQSLPAYNYVITENFYIK